MKRVLVIGGGLAGLSAAVRLADAGFRVEVLERGASPGGRIRRLVPKGHSQAIDRGQHLMLGCYHESIAMAKRLGTEYQLCSQHGTTPFLSGPGRVHPYRLGSLPAPLHALPGLVGLTQLRWLERASLARAVAAAKLQVHLDPGMLDGISAHQWLTKNGQGANAISGFWEPLTVATLNLPPGEASALLLATVIDKGFFAKRRDAIPLLPRTTLHDLFIAPAVAEIEAKNGRILCRERAQGVTSKESGREISAVTTQSGKRFEADFFLLAIPPWDIPQLLEKIPQLEWLSSSASRLSSSPIVGIELWFDRKWMRYPFAGFLNSPVQWIFNHHQNSLFGLNGDRYRVSLVISHAKRQVGSKAQELIAECASEVRRFFPEARKAEIIDSMLIRTSRATFRGAPAQSALRPPTETNLENLFLAGDWTDTGLPSTIESAVVSGKRAADAIEKRFELG